MYQRDRGDDWDARSVSSANLLASIKPGYPLEGRASPAPSKMVPGYDRYLVQGPQQEIEMSRLNVDQVPLLTAPQVPGYFDSTASRSNVSLATSYSYNIPPLGGSPQFPPQVPQVPPVPAMTPGQDYREAVLHRPYPSARQASGYAPSEEANMAGRGAFRNY